MTFALDGQTYSIDLTTKNADKFRGLFMDYVAVASKVGRKSGTRGAKSQSGTSAKEIRDWARSSGLDLLERGRIPERVRAAFEAAKWPNAPRTAERPSDAAGSADRGAAPELATSCNLSTETVRYQVDAMGAASLPRGSG